MALLRSFPFFVDAPNKRSPVVLKNVGRNTAQSMLMLGGSFGYGVSCRASDCDLNAWKGRSWMKTVPGGLAFVGFSSSQKFGGRSGVFALGKSGIVDDSSVSGGHDSKEDTVQKIKETPSLQADLLHQVS